MTGTAPDKARADRQPTALPSALQQIPIIASFTKGYGWAIPVMAIAGLGASLMESLAISGVILLLYMTIGPGASAANPGGVLSHLFEAAGTLIGGSSAGLAVLIIMLVAAKSVLSVGYSLLTARIKHSVNERARNRIYSKYLHVPYGEIQDRDHGALVNTLANESWAISEAFYSYARIGTNIAAFVVFGGILLAISWQITLIAAAGSTALFWSLRLLVTKVRDMGREARDANRELAEHMTNTLHALRTIRAYAQESAREQLFGRTSRRASRTLVRMERLQSLLAPITEISYLLLLAVIAWVSTLLAIPFAATLSAVALLYRLRPHIREFDGNRLTLAGLSASLSDVQDIVNRPDEQSSPAGARPFRGLTDAVRFEGVSFRYSGAKRPVLRDLNFAIRRGKTTAIIGPSGSGKTTIVNLLLQLYQPSAGSILVDSTPLPQIDRSSWLARLAVAGQDVELIDDTVIANIRLGRPDAGQSEIERAARLAGIHEFILSLPNGFDSWIGEHGLNISGGQRQRLGLARALVRQPEFLILDEATNALEQSLERRILANVAECMAGGTVVLITQRLDTLKHADHIVRLRHGEVQAQGPVATVLRASVA